MASESTPVAWFDPNDNPEAPMLLANEARRSSRRWVARAALASGGLLSVMTAGALYVVDAITRASKVTPFDRYTFTPFELNLPWEDVRIPSADGGYLAGWWFPQLGTNHVVLVCYGYRNRKADMLGVGGALWRRGYNVLLFDYHGHGEHAGTRVTLGYREVEDALTAVRYACERIPDAQLGVLGYSMGAAVAIMAAARDRRIRAVIADSPFAAQRNPVSRRVHQRLHLSFSDRPLLFLVDHLLHWLIGYRFRDVEPVREVTALDDRPLLLIHGTGDSIIDYHDSELLYAAASGPKELWLLEGVEHCGAYFVDRPAYVERLGAFLDSSLGARGLPRQQVG